MTGGSSSSILSTADNVLKWISPAYNIGSQVYKTFKSIPDADEFSSVNSSGSVDSSPGNNDLMSYLQGLLASQGQEALENRLFNQQEAKASRDWQERMSNTSYQRAVADLQKAGLNPILAYQQGGASTPSGSSASYNVGGGDTLSSLLQAFSSLLSSAGDIGSVLAALAG